MNSKDFTAASCLGLIVYIVLLIAVGTLAEAYVLIKLWQWFVMPLFEWAPQLTIGYAIGLSLIAGVLTYQVSSNENNKDKYDDMTHLMVDGVVRVLGRPAIYLLFGWIALQLI